MNHLIQMNVHSRARENNADSLGSSGKGMNHSERERNAYKRKSLIIVLQIKQGKENSLI